MTEQGILWFTNGRIYCPQAGFQPVSSLAVGGSRIVGTSNQYIEGDQEIRDLGGMTVIPALGDAHTHFLQYCMRSVQVDLDGAGSLEEALTLIAQHAEVLPAGSWLMGGGWNKNQWQPALWPSREDLDGVVPQTPVVLASKDCHCLWCNSEALKRAHIDEDTPEVSGGEIVRDAQGRPTGILKENATQQMWDIMPEPSPEKLQKAMREGIGRMSRWGVASVHVMEGAETLRQLQSLHDRRMRFQVSIPHPDLYHAMVLGLRSGYGDEWLRLGPVKMFADGALGSQTAYLDEPYEGSSDDCGIFTLNQEELTEAICQAARAGWAAAVHAIGDRANREVLNAMERAQPLARRWGLRQRIEHAQLIHPDDFTRFGNLGVIASVQPLHVLSDWSIADQYWGRRARWAYAFKSLLRHGAVLALGSDAPVESPHPWATLSAAVLRRDPEAEQAWYPQERLTVQEAVWAYTVGAALAAGEEKQRGSLREGQLADLIVLDRDIFSVSAEQLAEVQVLATMVGGAWVYVSEKMADRLQTGVIGNN